MRVTLSSTALRDRREAESYYRRRSPSVARTFGDELRAALRYIREYPEGAPAFYGPTRGKTMHRFPYTIVYVVDRDRIFVLTIANEYRDPDSYSRPVS